MSPSPSPSPARRVAAILATVAGAVLVVIDPGQLLAVLTVAFLVGAGAALYDQATR